MPLIPKLKLVTAYSSSWPSIPESREEFMAFWEEKFDRVPEQYHDSITIEIDAESDYGEPVLEVNVTYKQPYTVAELAELASLDQAADRREAVIRSNELEQLKRLQEKYTCP